MNIFTNIFLISSFLIAVLVCRLINICDDKFVVHKMWLFGLIFAWQYVVLMLAKIKGKCRINFAEVSQLSAETAVIAIVGYSLYTDMGYNITDCDDTKKYIYLVAIIIGLMFGVNCVKLLFGHQPYVCIENVVVKEEKKVEI